MKETEGYPRAQVIHERRDAYLFPHSINLSKYFPARFTVIFEICSRHRKVTSPAWRHLSTNNDPKLSSLSEWVNYFADITRSAKFHARFNSEASINLLFPSL